MKKPVRPRNDLTGFLKDLIDIAGGTCDRSTANTQRWRSVVSTALFYAQPGIYSSTDSRKIAIVSRAFSPPASADRKLVDKLARLNELLLAKTVSVRERCEYGYWVPFHSDQWRAEFGGGYQEIKDAAVGMGLIDSNERYSTGGALSPSGAYPESVRLTPEYRDGKFSEFELHRCRRAKKDKYAAECLESAGVWLAERLKEFQVVGGTPKTAWDALALNLFNRGIHRPHRCKYRRFHSTGTSLPKYLRAQLRANNVQHMVREPKEESRLPPGSPLTQLSPSSWFEAGMTGIRPDPSPEGSLHGSREDGLAQIDVVNCQALCLAAKLRKLGLSPEFVELAEQGFLYEHLATWLQQGDVPPYQVTTKRGKTFTIDPSTWERKQAKKGFMVWLFSEVEDSQSSPVGQAIQRLWPDVAEISDSTKNGHYQHMAHDCQRFESTIVIDGVCGHLAKHHPDLPVLTIHDCLIVPQRSTGLITELMTTHFQRHGVTPQLKVDHLAA